MLTEWALAKLEAVSDEPRLLLRDPYRLLPEAGGPVHRFAAAHGYTAIVASTNLAFRDLYEQAIADPDAPRLLVVDRAVARRRPGHAPAPFYPDFLAQLPARARLELDLRQFLREQTGEDWPSAVSDDAYARLIVKHLAAVLRAHENLRTADRTRFSDDDFRRIVTYAALGIPDAAFTRLGATAYWKIGLLGLEELEELDRLAPQVTRTLREELRAAPWPFNQLADSDPELVVHSFYLAVILAQHGEHWRHLLADIDPAVRAPAGVEAATLLTAARDVVAFDPVQAGRDLEQVERSLGQEALQRLLEELRLNEAEGCAALLERERYSTLLRVLALLSALENVLTGTPDWEIHRRILATLEPETAVGVVATGHTGAVWTAVCQAYRLAFDVQQLRQELTETVRRIGVTRPADVTFGLFWECWNGKGLNRLEYLLSALDRLVETEELLPRPATELPAAYGVGERRIRTQVRTINERVNRDLDTLNLRFQQLVRSEYASWARGQGDVTLTAQFLARCLKPHWDPEQEQAALFIFDGMRYDVWAEFLRPRLLETMDAISELPAASLLPTETQLTRKAISAGAFPEAFDPTLGEDRLLQAGLARELHLQRDVKPITTPGAATGETVRYRAGNLDVFILDLCDEALHHIAIEKHGDREVPALPLAFVYEQRIKNIIDREVMHIVRDLTPGTKVFVTADHGFGRVPTGRLPVDEVWLNDSSDCKYRNVRLRLPLNAIQARLDFRQNVWEFPVADLRLPATVSTLDRQSRRPVQRSYASLLFPKPGYSFVRPGARFEPTAYGHGGVSLQELLIPMVVLQVRQPSHGLLTLSTVEGPTDAVEGEELTFRVRLSRTGQSSSDELRVDLEAAWGREPGGGNSARQTLFVGAAGQETIFRLPAGAADASDAERRQGTLQRTLLITASYKEGRRTVRLSQSRRFTVRLNTERIARRVPPSLGSILGMVPKSMR